MPRVFGLHLLQLFEWVMSRSDQLSPILSSIVKRNTSVCVLPSIELHIASPTLIVNTLHVLTCDSQMYIIAVEVVCGLCLYLVVWACAWRAEKDFLKVHGLTSIVQSLMLFIILVFFSSLSWGHFDLNLNIKTEHW